MPLSDLAIHNAKPGVKPIKMYDANGMYLEVAPAPPFQTP
ncbi:DUF4102 domain-containing protein [Noviherbaspirillum sedimenti]|uniref:DUF4102 domain-containing protein n=1 Tax=Noviherbaspirillum sedimenti TaxID=2320865 RepID=A0A3A3G875_9BURK|nr:DUF4102 domain-containing protein [Noviherbaspirillum sedimenti]